MNYENIDIDMRWVTRIRIVFHLVWSGLAFTWFPSPSNSKEETAEEERRKPLNAKFWQNEHEWRKKFLGFASASHIVIITLRKEKVMQYRKNKRMSGTVWKLGMKPNYGTSTSSVQTSLWHWHFAMYEEKERKKGFKFTISNSLFYQILMSWVLLSPKGLPKRFTQQNNNKR